MAARVINSRSVLQARFRGYQFHLLGSYRGYQYIIRAPLIRSIILIVMAKTGKRKHWSQSALGAVGHGIRIAKRVHRAYKGARRVVRKFKAKRVGAKRGLRRKKTDVIGTFVKCKDWKPSKFGVKSKKSQAFARKVNSVVYDSLPRSTELYSYAWNVSNYSNTSNGAVKWFQFVLDPLQAATTGYNIGNGQLGPYYVAEPGNPAGIGTILKQEDVFSTSTLDMTGPTVSSSTFDKQTIAANILVDPRKECVWRQTASTMRVQFKNIKSYALSLEVMLVKPKKAISSFMRNNRYQTDENSGMSSLPIGWTQSDQMGMTPLELGQLGLARVGAVGSTRLNLWTNPMLSLNDSTDFNEFYTITHKCKVYLPPGGVVEKSIHHGTARLLKQAHVSNNLFDRRTTFMVIKYIPEVQLLETPSGGILGGGIPSAVVENTTDIELVGTVNYRMGFKQMYGTSPVANLHQYNRQIIANQIVGGTATSVHTKAP